MFSGTTEAAAVDVTGSHRAYGSIVRRMSALVFIGILRDGPPVSYGV
jgi:hypothetical protein